MEVQRKHEWRNGFGQSLGKVPVNISYQSQYACHNVIDTGTLLKVCQIELGH